MAGPGVLHRVQVFQEKLLFLTSCQHSEEEDSLAHVLPTGSESSGLSC